MRALIQFLEKNNFQRMIDRALECHQNKEPISENLKVAFDEISKVSSSHIDGRLIQLEAIGKLLVLAGEDQDNGSFEQTDLVTVGHFLSEEMATLQELQQIKNDAEYFGRGGEL
ncbi:hypothetical protein [Thiomicrorhabdus indica]|uniref:hypothetical protein n=1 Tax=Thiomicrorhabdus indica TaxID=2267253 RepID=UPI002AA8D614|nr:hypothetical protein [Thiomicrorhabdus indica]